MRRKRHSNTKMAIACRLLLCLSATLIPLILASCGSQQAQILFQSNAYAESLVNDSSKSHGVIITSLTQWDEFRQSFKPNHQGESLSREDINFNEEKVVIGTYYTSATCSVEIDDVRLECGDESMKIELNVFDASLGCNIACMAAGQVIYAVAIPLEWDIQTNDITIDATGPCVEETSTSSTDEVFTKFNIVPFSLALCDSGECLSPNGTCAEEVNCFVDPCDVNECDEGEVCSANYCGGCHAVCTLETVTEDGEVSCSQMGMAAAQLISLEYCPSSTAEMIEYDISPYQECKNEAASICEAKLYNYIQNYGCGITTSQLLGLQDTCEETLLEMSASTAVSLTNNASITTIDDEINGILLDTTTSGTASGVDVDESIDTATGSNNVAPVPAAVLPTDDDLCDQIRVGFESNALSRYLVPDGKSSESLTTVTSQDELDKLLAGFLPTSGDDTGELENVDFATEQVIFVSYYQSSTCNVELLTANFICEGTVVKIGVAVLDESVGCEVACEAEDQVVYAIVTPLGADASLDVAINGPCLDAPQLDSVTVATDPTPEVTEPSTTQATTTEATTTDDADTDAVSSSRPTASDNVPEGIPRIEGSSCSSRHMSPVVMFGTALLIYLSWRL